ncbi:MAG: LemA family protein [Chitinophagaceae bacterium]|jgi:LemA protein|nr:LemA family protein [Chitinophagaceae bacterium]MBP6047391.1 LemA family protein [Ferruginibacter sp.]NMD29549.1 LemA family protein [Bacteroidota bacterium]MBK7090020.1 LemA family protein [Chitinophagaceae bacterium]MBK7346046.1 LemA family protein [Chitinophagaceae bacterium]
MKSVSTLVILGILAVLVFVGCNGYNGLVKQDESVKKAWNNVQAEYQNRNDLVGNLVNTVKGAANFEQKTLTDVIQARAKATSVNINADNLTPEKLAEFQQAQNGVSSALSRLLVSVEAYPDLKATANFTQLQNQLEGIENNIKNSRKIFNEEINVYNTKVRSFPMNILGGMFGFKAKEGFAADAGAEKKPEVDFSK